MERVLGSGMGDFVRGLHEDCGVIFHLGDSPAIDHVNEWLRAALSIPVTRIVDRARLHGSHRWRGLVRPVLREAAKLVKTQQICAESR
jgi:hypothetical protein